MPSSASEFQRKALDPRFAPAVAVIVPGTGFAHRPEFGNDEPQTLRGFSVIGKRRRNSGVDLAYNTLK
jgi:hypothetical protein